MFVFGLLVGLAVAAVASYAFFRYGTRLESRAWDELRALKTALTKTGIRLDAYYSGDVNRIHNEIKSVLKLPQTLGDFITEEAKAHNIRL